MCLLNFYIMKKLILLLFAVILGMNMSAQERSPVEASIVVKGGYNFLEKQPVAQVSLFGNFAFVRFGVSFNYAFIKTDVVDLSQLPAFSPSIGLTYGDKNVVYLMCGAQPWGVLDKETNKLLPRDRWRCSLEAGYDIRLSDRLFFNLSAFYLLPGKETETTRLCQNLSILAGLGFRL